MNIPKEAEEKVAADYSDDDANLFSSRDDVGNWSRFWVAEEIMPVEEPSPARPAKRKLFKQKTWARRFMHLLKRGQSQGIFPKVWQMHVQKTMTTLPLPLPQPIIIDSRSEEKFEIFCTAIVSRKGNGSKRDRSKCQLYHILVIFTSPNMY